MDSLNGVVRIDVADAPSQCILLLYIFGIILR